MQGPVLLLWSPDGERLASCRRGDDTVTLEKPGWQRFLLLDVIVFDMEWSPDSCRIATRGHMSLVVWDAATAQVEWQLDVRVNSLAWGGPGLALSFGDRVTLYDDKGTALRELSDCYSPLLRWLGDDLFVIGYQSCMSYDLWAVIWRDGVPPLRQPFRGRVIAMAPDSPRAVVVTAHSSLVWTPSSILSHGDFAIQAAWSPDGEHLALCTAAGVRVHDRAGRVVHTVPGANLAVWGSALRLATLRRGVVQTWLGGATWRCTGRLAEGITALAWGARGDLALMSDDGCLSFWAA